MNPGGPPKTKVTAWEACEILMKRIDKELDQMDLANNLMSFVEPLGEAIEKIEKESCEKIFEDHEFDSMAAKITQPFSIDKAIRG